MSKYQELRKAFAESVERQRQYLNDCCEFANFTFDKMSEYCAWPREQISFSRDEHSEVSVLICNNTVANIKGDGYVHFMVIFTVQRLDNANHSFQFIMPIKIRKLEESFLVQIRDSSEEFMLNTNDMEELKRFCEYIFELMKRRFDTPFLDFTTRDFLKTSERQDVIP